MEKAMEQEPVFRQDSLERLLDFAVELGARIQVCGGEFWRTEEMLRCVFRAYGVQDAQIFLLPHLLLVSVCGGGGPQHTRQKEIGDTAVDLEELTRLSRVARRVCLVRPDPDGLANLLAGAAPAQGYSFGQSVCGMVLALLCLVYLFGGGVMEAVFSVAGILFIQLMQWVASHRFRDCNKMAMNAAGTFAAGMAALLAARYLALDPYLVMIVVAFGLMPGVPLINSFRELLCGRVMTGSLLVMQVFAETLAIVAGYYLSIVLFG